MDSVLSDFAVEAKKFAASADATTKKRLMAGLRDIQLAIESPAELLQRLLYTIPFQHLTMASIRVCLDLKVYDILSESKSPLPVDQIANCCTANPVLLGEMDSEYLTIDISQLTLSKARFLRHQASLGMIKETGPNCYEANKTTHVLTTPELQSGIKFNYDVSVPAFQALPEFLAERDYENPTDIADTAFRKAWKTDLPLWLWLQDKPVQMTCFNKFMQGHRTNVSNCFSYLPLDRDSESWPADKPLFVDIGGGTGQQVMALKDQFPNIPGRVILQDQPQVIGQAEVSRGVEAMAHDFFKPQPITGAKYYYLRQVLHDFPDSRCLEILSRIHDAMTDQSTLLLDEVIVPNQDVEWYVTQTDLAMMAQFASVERTEDQWTKLLTQAGFKLKSITIYTDIFKMGIIAATAGL